MSALEVFKWPRRRVNGHSVVKAENGGYRCKCGIDLADRITMAREIQRFHVLDVWMSARRASENKESAEQ